ncbi:MAG: hypothetical protein IJ209_02120 [Bacteroidaceae bacterium]|nr:hypothetical protein [Bacteroidaceae bacterium]
MKLKKNQNYLQSRAFYADVCRLARLRARRHAIVIDIARLEEHIRRQMEPATEIVDLNFMRSNAGAPESERREMFVARIDVLGNLIVHPPFVSKRFRPWTDEVPADDAGTNGAEDNRQEHKC